MRGRLPLLVAWAALGVSLVANLAASVLELRRGSPPGVPPATIVDLQYIANSLLSSGAAVVIAWRRPRNLMWLLLGTVGLAGGLFGLTSEYAIYAHLVSHQGGWPRDAATWLSTWMFAFIPAVTAAILLLYPTGSYPSPRWRWFTPLLGAGFLLSVLATALHTGWVQDRPPGADGPIHNPLGVAAAGPILDLLETVSAVLLGVAFVGGLAALVQRFRRGSNDERQQLKLLIYVAAMAPLGFVTYPLSSSAGQPTPLSLAALAVGSLGALGFPIAICVAIVKYRLYDIDVVINRTLVYGALAAFITAVYVAIVVGIGSLVGSGTQPNLLLSIVATAVVAVAFQPVRERFQKIANRLVYGKRATPYEVLSDFSQGMTESYAGDQVLSRMAQVLAEGTGAEQALVWLRVGEVLRPAAAWPPGANGHGEGVAMVGQLLPDIPGTARTVAVRHQAELLGALSVRKRPGESLTPIEEKLLEDLARQAGLVLKNVGLTADLQARLEDLRASRQRLVAAQDEERRRLERNLHDGAQQHLVAIKVKLGLAEMLAGRDPDRATQTLQELRADTDEALETLRDLARGIYPPLLAEKGLPDALASQARKATIDVVVSADGIGRYSQDVEAAVYFCSLEALQNIQKYAGAGSAALSLDEAAGILTFEVTDRGRGYDPASTSRGSGLQNMADRLDALGGALEVITAIGEGVTVRGRLPVAPVAATA